MKIINRVIILIFVFFIFSHKVLASNIDAKSVEGNIMGGGGQTLSTGDSGYCQKMSLTATITPSYYQFSLGGNAWTSAYLYWNLHSGSKTGTSIASSSIYQPTQYRSYSYSFSTVMPPGDYYWCPWKSGGTGTMNSWWTGYDGNDYYPNGCVTDSGSASTTCYSSGVYDMQFSFLGTRSEPVNTTTTEGIYLTQDTLDNDVILSYLNFWWQWPFILFIIIAVFYFLRWFARKITRPSI